MNIILFHRGCNHSYFEICINQIIKYNPFVKIFFIGDSSKFIPNSVIFCNINELISDNINRFKISDFHKNNPNTLFRTSTERIFYIEALIDEYNLCNVFHFDNDVLIYDSFELILKCISSERNLITPANELNLVCGLFYTKNLNSIRPITNALIKLIELGEHKICELYNNRKIIYDEKIVESFSITEMSLLKIIQEDISIIENFPTHPKSSNFSKFQMCFDPSSWGQYLGGTHQGHPTGYFEVHHLIGRYIKDKIYNIIFDNGKPYILSSNNQYNLFNLHIHSKQLNLFV